MLGMRLTGEDERSPRARDRSEAYGVEDRPDSGPQTSARKNRARSSTARVPDMRARLSSESAVEEVRPRGQVGRIGFFRPK
jgi:hypothetical protein